MSIQTPERPPKTNPDEESNRLAGSAIGGAILGVSLIGAPGAVIGGLIGLFVAGNINASKRKERQGRG